MQAGLAEKFKTDSSPAVAGPQPAMPRPLKGFSARVVFAADQSLSLSEATVMRVTPYASPARTTLGAPNCKLYVDALLMTPFVRDANGQASRKVPIPSLPALTNLTFYTQWVNFDPAANSFGLSFSEATAVTIGGPKITGINSARLVSKDNNTSAVGEKFNNEMPVLKLIY